MSVSNVTVNYYMSTVFDQVCTVCTHTHTHTHQCCPLPDIHVVRRKIMDLVPNGVRPCDIAVS